jgi:hypothetical protein
MGLFLRFSRTPPPPGSRGRAPGFVDTAVAYHRLDRRARGDELCLYVMRRHGDLKHIYGEAPVALESAASYFKSFKRHFPPPAQARVRARNEWVREIE